MLVNFENLENTARVWIYQSTRAFSNNEEEIITKKLEAFIAKWQRHGDDLEASFIIKYNQFIVIAVDENFNEVSGCSIDASVNLIKQLEKELNVDLTNKLNVSFKDGDAINIVSLADFKNYAQQQKITSKTIVFNNMVATKLEFEQHWEITANNSWHKRFLTV